MGFFVSILSIHIHCLSNEVHRFEVHTLRVLTNDEFEELKKNKKERIQFVSRNASIYKDSPTTIIFSKGTKKKKESFLEFLARAPISFDEGDK